MLVMRLTSHRYGLAPLTVIVETTWLLSGIGVDVLFCGDATASGGADWIPLRVRSQRWRVPVSPADVSWTREGPVAVGVLAHEGAERPLGDEGGLGGVVHVDRAHCLLGGVVVPDRAVEDVVEVPHDPRRARVRGGRLLQDHGRAGGGGDAEVELAGPGVGDERRHVDVRQHVGRARDVDRLREGGAPVGDEGGRRVGARDRRGRDARRRRRGGGRHGAIAHREGAGREGRDRGTGDQPSPT